jgi:hypothetical protein
MGICKLLTRGCHFYRPTECDYEFNAQKLALFVRSIHKAASDIWKMEILASEAQLLIVNPYANICGEEGLVDAQ